MSETFIEPESLNSTLVSLDAILDEDGAVRLLNKEVASYNFDGVIPTAFNTILVNELEVGMSFLPIGETEGALRTIVKIESDDPEMTDSPTNDYIISYLSPGGEIQSVTYDGNESIEVYFEDWDDKVLGTKGWLITQEGNAIFSNVAVRGRIEATEGFLENLGITGFLTVESGGGIVIGTNPGTPGNPGIIIDETGIFAYDNNENQTISISASTGEVLISSLDQIIEDLEDFVQEEFDDLDLLLSSSYVANFQIFNPGTTLISGNKISTGIIDAANVTISSGAGGATQGIKITQTGITAYNTLGNPTFFLNSSNGNATFTGTISGSNINTSTITSGLIQSADFSGTANGANFSLDGTAINLADGSITSREFRIDTNGDAEFRGNLVAAGGTFSGTLSANSITSGTLDASLITVTNLSANSITSGVLSANRISGGTLDASLITVTNLSANSITTGTFSGDRISGGTITGATVRTAGSGRRVQLNGTGDTGVLEFYDPGLKGIIFPTLSGLGISGTPEILMFSLLRADSGAVIGPASFSNAQTPLQIRLSDNRVGIQSSTLDIKENIIPLTGVQSDVVAKEKNGVGKDHLLINPDNIFEITPVQYSIVGQSSNIKEIGFIVEDLEQKWPAAVSYDKNNKPVSYNTNSIVAGLIYAIKKQKDIIEELERKVSILESKVIK